MDTIGSLAFVSNCLIVMWLPLSLLYCLYSSASVIVVDLGNLDIKSSSKEFVVRLHCIVCYVAVVCVCVRVHVHAYVQFVLYIHTVRMRRGM